jgi:hypothetical protein
VRGPVGRWADAFGETGSRVAPHGYTTGGIQRRRVRYPLPTSGLPSGATGSALPRTESPPRSGPPSSTDCPISRPPQLLSGWPCSSGAGSEGAVWTGRGASRRRA